MQRLTAENQLMGGGNMTGTAKYLPANNLHTGSNKHDIKFACLKLQQAPSRNTTVDAGAANKTLMERSLEDSPG